MALKSLKILCITWVFRTHGLTGKLLLPELLYISPRHVGDVVCRARGVVAAAISRHSSTRLGAAPSAGHASYAHGRTRRPPSGNASRYYCSGLTRKLHRTVQSAKLPCLRFRPVRRRRYDKSADGALEADRDIVDVAAHRAWRGRGLGDGVMRNAPGSLLRGVAGGAGSRPGYRAGPRRTAG
jgi:hypothetical protein